MTTEGDTGLRAGITPMEIRLAGGIVLTLLAANPAVQLFKPDEEPRTITLQLDGIREDIREVKGLVDGWRSEVGLLNQRINTHENWIRSRTDPTEGTMTLRIKALEDKARTP